MAHGLDRGACRASLLAEPPKSSDAASPIMMSVWQARTVEWDDGEKPPDFANKKILYVTSSIPDYHDRTPAVPAAALNV